jgi:transcriptional regulator with XRE-family HTH domain
MTITNQTPDAVALAELGSRLERIRLDQNMTQEQVADAAGVSRQTVARIEAGETAKLPAFIRVLRALGMLGALERAIPPPLPSPIEQLERQGRQRQRARPRRTEDDQPTSASWTWGTQ